MPLDETGVRDASYGPAGLITTGAGFKEGDIEDLRDSYRKLNAAIRRLRREHKPRWVEEWRPFRHKDAPRILRRDRFPLWAVLIGPYLGDPADPSIVDDWREKVRALDKENTEIRKSNEKREALLRKGKKAHPYQYPKVRYVFARRQLERHDRAIKALAEDLKDEKLHVVYPKLMSEREKAAGEAHNAQVYAYWQRMRVAGGTEKQATRDTALEFKISEPEVERVVEFRSENKLASCAEPECGQAVFSQNLCERHYRREYRARKRRAG